jgi:prepilin-type N-terminal cleavage/methylation domain-containing protein
MIHLRRDNEGFTLIEILFALTLFAVALLAIAKMQIVAIATNADANRMSSAATLAQDKMEELKGMSYDDAQLSEGNYADVPITGYNRTWTIAIDTPVNDTKTVTVSVSWEAGQHQAQMQTIICR